jgi:hypothetical protein
MGPEPGTADVRTGVKRRLGPLKLSAVVPGPGRIAFGCVEYTVTSARRA